MTWYLLAFLVWLILLSVQLILAIIMVFDRRNLWERFYHPLGSGVDVVQLLQKYSRIYGDVSIRVDAHIASPAQFDKDIVLINREHVYLPLLFPTLWTLMEVHKSQRRYWGLQHREQLLPFVFALELAFAVLALVWTPAVWVAVGLALALIILTIYAEIRMDALRKEVMELANDLLELDSVEHARATKLIAYLGGGSAGYPLELVQKVVGFVLPF